MLSHWDTAELATEDQLGYWADVLCQAFTPLAVSRATPGWVRSAERTGLPGWVRAQRLAATNCAEIASCTQHLTHGTTEVSRSPSEAVFVNLQLSGSCLGEQDGRQCVVSPGSFAVFDTTRPYALAFAAADDGTPWRVLSFRVPREQLAPFLGESERASARTIDASCGPGVVAATMMTSLWNTREKLSPQECLALDHTFSQVVATALGAFAEPDDHKRTGTDAALRAAVARLVAERIRFGPVHAEQAAAHVGVSLRKLHALFAETDTTFGGLVRQQRLDRCAQDLATADGGSVTEIAHRWGFCDSSHLSRNFARAFGCTPTEHRSLRRRQHTADA